MWYQPAFMDSSSISLPSRPRWLRFRGERRRLALVLQWSPVEARSSAQRKRGPVHHAIGRFVERITSSHSPERAALAVGDPGVIHGRD